MTDQIDQLGYDAKPTEYFQVERPDMLRFIPEQCRRLLDVGCAEGGFGEALKKSRQLEVWGVEPSKSAAAVAKARLDRVIEGVFEPESGLPAQTFDCIVLNDVLEHMLAPEMALRYAKELLAPGGVVVASIPNIRYLPVIRDLVIHARWDYVDSGVLDRTHLRFFTRSSIIDMFERVGFAIESISGINDMTAPPHPRNRLWWAYNIVNLLSLRNCDDMRFQQFAVVAKPVGQEAKGNCGNNR